MKTEDYFDIQSPDDIRIKGTRIGIETVLYEYIYKERTAEEIAQHWVESLTLEQVYATILYYLSNKEVISKYMTDWVEWSYQQRKAQDESQSPLLRQLRQREYFRQKLEEMNENREHRNKLLRNTSAAQKMLDTTVVPDKDDVELSNR